MQQAAFPGVSLPGTCTPASVRTGPKEQLICVGRVPPRGWIVYAYLGFPSRKPEGNLRAETIASVGVCGFTVGIGSCVWPETTAPLAFIPCFRQAAPSGNLRAALGGVTDGLTPLSEGLHMVEIQPGDLRVLVRPRKTDMAS